MTLLGDLHPGEHGWNGNKPETFFEALELKQTR